jgi:repressor LexA
MKRMVMGRTRERIYRFVRDRLLSGRPPTVREVQRAFRFRAVQTARHHLERLVEEGRLRKEAGKARGYRLREEMPQVRAVPVVGRVQAGPDFGALEETLGHVPVEGRAGGGELFALRVRGESMRDLGILAGDLVVVRRQATARTGDVVVAMVGEEAMVKVFRRGGGRVELHSAHPDYRPVVPDPEEFRLLGKVIEVRRSLEG